MSGSDFYVDVKKNLLNVKVDPTNADRVFSDTRVFMTDKSACPIPTTYDIYGRMAAPITLDRRGGKGCNSLDPVWNVQQVIANENAMRPVVQMNYVPGRYDTMGMGRNSNGSLGGFNGEGSWLMTSPSQMPSASCGCASPSQPMRNVSKTNAQAMSRVVYQG
uniref:Uncharacterized protein n=1 Tax=viral metagenome TaxID=1070528 RepID=A0A6C0M0S7_9ZZZZ